MSCEIEIEDSFIIIFLKFKTFLAPPGRDFLRNKNIIFAALNHHWIYLLPLKVIVNVFEAILGMTVYHQVY